MHRCLPLLALVVVALVPRPAEAQEGGPMGFAVPLFTMGGTAALSTPLLLTNAPVSRPTAGLMRTSLGYQSGPSSFVLETDIGGYFSEVDALGWEARGFSQTRSETEVGFRWDAGPALRLTPVDSPLSLELQVGGTIRWSANLGDQQFAFGGGIYSGARAGAAIPIGDLDLVLETEARYRCDWGTDHEGLEERLEIGGGAEVRIPLEAGPTIAFGARYRQTREPEGGDAQSHFVGLMFTLSGE